MEVDMEVLVALRKYYDTEYTNEERGPILQARIDALSDTSYWEMYKEWRDLEGKELVVFYDGERYVPGGKPLYDALVTLRDEQLQADREAADTYNEIQENKYD